MKKSIVQVSDHAVIRYLEQVLLMDIETLRRRIGREIDNAMIPELGEPCTVTIDGIVFRLREQTVTTVVAKGDQDGTGILAASE